jgi:hypothetical protein
MYRTTKIEATAWAETGPAPPRISYRREVELQTIGGITFYLDIRGTVALAPGTALPTSPDAALHMRGRVVRSQRSVHVEGADVIEGASTPPTRSAANRSASSPTPLCPITPSSR